MPEQLKQQNVLAWANAKVYVSGLENLAKK
jgi:hypothetical protein